MNETELTPQEGKKEKEVKTPSSLQEGAKVAGAGAAGVALGVGMSALDAEGAELPNPEEIMAEMAEAPEVPPVFEPETPNRTPHHASPGRPAPHAAAPASQTAPEAIVEAVEEPSAEEEVVDLEEVEAAEVPAEEDESVAEAENTEESDTDQLVEETEAEAVEAVETEAEMVDPEDIEPENVVDFNGVQEVEVGDQILNGYTYQDSLGNDLMMVDVDQDGQFDVITDANGRVIAQAPGQLNESDAEEHITDSTEYLAGDSAEGTDTGLDLLDQDMIC